MNAPKASLTVALLFVHEVAYLERALQSVLRQDDPAWRLIVCDDSATDAIRAQAAAILRRYDDPRIEHRVLSGHLDMAANFNRCADLATAARYSPLFSILHADDELLPNYCSTVVAAFERRPESAIVFCSAKIVGADSRRRFSTADFVKRLTMPRGRGDIELAGETGLRALLRGNFVMNPTMCFRREALANLRFPEDTTMPDLGLLAEVLFAEHTIAGVRRPSAYLYRRHPQQRTSLDTKTLLRFREEVRLYDRIGARALARGWTRAAAVARGKRIVRLNLAFCIAQDAARLRWADMAVKVRFLFALGRPGRGAREAA